MDANMDNASDCSGTHGLGFESSISASGQPTGSAKQWSRRKLSKEGAQIRDAWWASLNPSKKQKPPYESRKACLARIREFDSWYTMANLQSVIKYRNASRDRPLKSVAVTATADAVVGGDDAADDLLFPRISSSMRQVIRTLLAQYPSPTAELTQVWARGLVVEEADVVQYVQYLKQLKNSRNATDAPHQLDNGNVQRSPQALAGISGVNGASEHVHRNLEDMDSALTARPLLPPIRTDAAILGATPISVGVVNTVTQTQLPTPAPTMSPESVPTTRWDIPRVGNNDNEDVNMRTETTVSRAVSSALELISLAANSLASESNTPSQACEQDIFSIDDTDGRTPHKNLQVQEQSTQCEGPRRKDMEKLALSLSYMRMLARIAETVKAGASPQEDPSSRLPESPSGPYAESTSRRVNRTSMSNLDAVHAYFQSC